MEKNLIFSTIDYTLGRALFLSWRFLFQYTVWKRMRLVQEWYLGTMDMPENVLWGAVGSANFQTLVFLIEVSDIHKIYCAQSPTSDFSSLHLFIYNSIPHFNKYEFHSINYSSQNLAVTVDLFFSHPTSSPQESLLALPWKYRQNPTTYHPPVLPHSIPQSAMAWTILIALPPTLPASIPASFSLKSSHCFYLTQSISQSINNLQFPTYPVPIWPHFPICIPLTHLVLVMLASMLFLKQAKTHSFLRAFVLAVWST